ncbi:MAG: Ig-like domain-containing protein, partial [Pseudomonadota bacterium]
MMRIPRFASIFRVPSILSAALLFVVSGLVASSSLSLSAGTPPVWVSDGGDQVWQIDADTHTVLRGVALPDGARALAVDPYDHSLWALTETRLMQFSVAGIVMINTSLASYLDAGDTNYKPVLNPYGGNLWVGAGKTLLRLNPQGTPDIHTRLPDVIRQLAMGFDETLWVLTQKELISFSPAGQVTRRNTLVSLGFTATNKPESIAVDALGKVLWLSAPRTLVRINTAVFDAPALVHTQPAPQPQFISPIALNAFDGTLSLATGDTLLMFDRQGVLQRMVNLAAWNVKKPRGVVFEPQSKTLWLGANGGLIAHLSAGGALLGTLTSGSDPQGETIFGVMPAHLLPTLKLKAPASGSRINYASPQIELTLGASCNGWACDIGDEYLSALMLEIAIDGVAIPASAWAITGNDAVYSPGALPEGAVDIEGTATDFLNHVSATLHDSFIIDLPPVITVTSPINGLLTNQAQQTLLGFVNEPVQLTLNGTLLAAPPPTQQFTHTLTLQEGINHYSLVAIDLGGNQTTYAFSLTLDSIAPAPAAVDIGAIVDGNVSVTGTAEAGSTVTVTNLRTSISTSLVVGAAGTWSTQQAAQGGDTFRVVVTDAAGNASAASEAQVAGGLPPDPARVAPPVDPTVASIIATTTEFLYTGSNPIQTGVAPGTIEPIRVAVLRGKVLARDNTALSGVTITVQGHPEFGQTLSRIDGMFDMAVNGGGYITLNYSKAGYLPAQRQLNTPWQDFAFADDVVLIPLDSNVTTIALNTNAIQVAQGNPVTDADGTRTATMLFPAGTQATMRLPDGSTQALTTLHVRATEYTVGENGPKAMPGPLPPTSGYTYAVELSVDEAMAAGAKEVRFNQPVPVYVDNFLNFPVGGIVPVGYYDRDKAAWVPSDNGKVIKILAIANGSAQLDTDGDGAADDAAKLAALNITAAEQAQLATLYTAGKTLWRAPVTHFTPFDCNWPVKLPPDAIPPRQPEPGKDRSEDKPDCQGGSIIECQNQILGERLPVTGTPFSLNYRSDRVPGRKISSTLEISLSGANIPGSVLGISLDISVAGRQFRQTFARMPNQTYRFEWDGKDVYGRPLQGIQLAKVVISYRYAMDYVLPAFSGRAFAVASAESRPIGWPRVTGWLLQEFYTTIVAPDARRQGLGGWGLDVHHVYSSVGQKLYLGDGGRRSAQSLSLMTDTVAGPGRSGFPGDGGPATAAGLYYPSGVAVDAQGNLYIADQFHHRIRQVTPDGLISTVAGNGSRGFSGDGGPATAARLGYPSGVAVDAQGNLYIADRDNNRIRQVTPDGLISTVAGGIQGFSGDGGPATAAGLGYPSGVVVDAQGNLYIADRDNNRIRQVTLD